MNVFEVCLETPIPISWTINYVTMRWVDLWVCDQAWQVGEWVKNGHFRHDVIIQWDIKYLSFDIRVSVQCFLRERPTLDRNRSSA